MIPTLFSSCVKKEKIFEVQGTIVSRQTQLPIEGLEIAIVSDYNYSEEGSAGLAKTDSLGRFLVRETSVQIQYCYAKC